MDEDRTGLKSGTPGPEMPYSVSMPITFAIAMAGPGYRVLQVLAGVDPLHLATLVSLGPAEQGPHVDDPLALLAGDPGPVVRVGGVGQILVLLELVADGLEHVLPLQPLLALRQEPLDGHLLRPGHDVLDHGARVEILEIEDLLVAGGVGDLQEAVLLGLGIHPLHRVLDHRRHGPGAVAAGRADVLVVERDL